MLAMQKDENMRSFIVVNMDSEHEIDQACMRTANGFSELQVICPPRRRPEREIFIALIAALRAHVLL